MLNKRLIRFLSGAKMYVGLTVGCQWFGLVANICIMAAFAFLINSLLAGNLSNKAVILSCGGILLAVIVKSISHMLAVKYSTRSFLAGKKGASR